MYTAIIIVEILTCQNYWQWADRYGKKSFQINSPQNHEGRSDTFLTRYCPLSINNLRQIQVLQKGSNVGDVQLPAGSHRGIVILMIAHAIKKVTIAI